MSLRERRRGGSSKEVRRPAGGGVPDHMDLVGSGTDSEFSVSLYLFFAALSLQLPSQEAVTQDFCSE